MCTTNQKNAFRKNSKENGGNCFKRENIILIILRYNIKPEIMTTIKIYHLFASVLVLICSRRQKINK